MRFIGIDNGVSGSIAVVSATGEAMFYEATPVVYALNYTVKKAWVHRVNHMEMGRILCSWMPDARCVLERPMVNPGRFQATASALRALESTLIALESYQIPYEYVDSRKWQKVLLPSGLKGDELKVAANEVCARLFPTIKLKKPGAGDSLLMAEWLRRKYTQGGI